MTEARRDGLYLLLSGVLCFLLLAALFGKGTPGAMEDFKVIYYPAKCLILHGDPYNQKAVLLTYQSGQLDQQLASPVVRQIETQLIYPPTTLAVALPFALLPWRLASLLWLALTAAALIAASFVTWDAAAAHAPVLSAALIALLLSCGEAILILGNPAGIAIALCVITVRCFVKEKWIVAGVVCLAIGLALKPHDVGLVWLCFLLSGGTFRKRALQTLLVLGAFSLPVILMIWHSSPSWFQELASNISAISVPGGPADFSPAPIGSRGGGVYINLQPAIRLLRNDPQLANILTYGLCLALLLTWAYVTLRHRSTPEQIWLSLATIAPLSMLPVYHHLLDAKLLLLTVPACSILLAKRHPLRWAAFALAASGIFITADLPWAAFLALIQHFDPLSRSRALLAAQILPAPLTLLVMSLLFLWLQAETSKKSPVETTQTQRHQDDQSRN